MAGAFRQFVESPCCRHILFGACHDNGYVRTLEKYFHNPAVEKKVTLLKSFQTGKEFGSLPFISTEMDSVFRSRPLTERSISPLSRNGNEVGQGSQVLPGPIGNPIPPRLAGHEIPTTATVSAEAQHVSITSTYAGQVAILPPRPRKLPLFGTTGADKILVNDDNHRVDYPLPARSVTAADSFYQKTRLGSKRFCNMHHLYGKCTGNCGYSHEQLTIAEKLVMRDRLRGERCNDGGQCRDPRCFYGHHCSCEGSKKCHFPVGMHNVDVSTWRIETIGY